MKRTLAALTRARNTAPPRSISIPYRTLNPLLECIISSKHTHQAIVDMYDTRATFNPSFNVNKFVVGGICELILAKLIENCGFTCKNIASEATKVDLLVEGFCTLSLKNSADVSDVTIANYAGNERGIAPLPPTLITICSKDDCTFLYLDEAILAASGWAKTGEDGVYVQKNSRLNMKKAFIQDMLRRLQSPHVVKFKAPPPSTVLPMDPIEILYAAMVSARTSAPAT
jgi:hypothetical protein